MAFGSNDFPLGPNGQFPKNRINNFGNRIGFPNRVEDVYRNNDQVKLPVVEKDFNSSIDKVKRRMKMGREMRKGQKANKFRPKYMAEELEGMGAVKNRPRPFKRVQQRIRILPQPQYKYPSDDIYRGPRPGEAF